MKFHNRVHTTTGVTEASAAASAAAAAAAAAGRGFVDFPSYDGNPIAHYPYAYPDVSLAWHHHSLQQQHQQHHMGTPGKYTVNILAVIIWLLYLLAVLSAAL